MFRIHRGIGLLVLLGLLSSCDDASLDSTPEFESGARSVEAELGVVGGVLELRSRARLSVPSDALEDGTTLRVEVGDLKGIATRPDEYEVVGEPLVITPHGLRLQRSATLEIAIDDDESPRRELRVLRLDDEEDRAWEELDDIRLVEADEAGRIDTGTDMPGDTVTAQRRLEFEVDGFSIFLPVRLRMIDGDCVGKSQGKTCRSSVSDCDAPEVCDGESPTCPDDGVAKAGTECRSSVGICDVAESCDGSSAQCPEDETRAAGSVCRPTRDVCDVREVCDGSSAACPADVVQVAGFECRAAADACDIAEACDGTAVDCPTDQVIPDCGDDGGSTTAPETACEADLDCEVCTTTLDCTVGSCDSGVCRGSDTPTLGCDVCGLCGGSGIPSGDCDCMGNVDDACGVCGGDGLSCTPFDCGNGSMVPMSVMCDGTDDCGNNADEFAGPCM